MGDWVCKTGYGILGMEDWVWNVRLSLGDWVWNIRLSLGWDGTMRKYVHVGLAFV